MWTHWFYVLIVLLFIFYDGILDTQAELINLALGKNAYQPDSYSDATDASKAVDGGISQNFGSCAATYTTGGAATWEVDLGESFVIDHVKIYGRLDCCTERLSNVQLFLGQTRDDYILRGFHPGEVGSTTTLQMELPVIGQWIKINRAPGDNVLTLCEVQVMGRPINNFNTYKIYNQLQIEGTPISTGKARSPMHCSFLCRSIGTCSSVQYNVVSKDCAVFQSIEHAPSSDPNDMIISPTY